MPQATTTSIHRPRAPRALLVLLLLSLLLVLLPSGVNAAAVEDGVEGGPLVATNLTFSFAGDHYATDAGAIREGHLRGRALQDVGCVVSLTIYTAAYQAQEVPGQVVWTFVSPAGESEPVSGGYRVWVRGETYSRDVRISLCGEFTAVKARLTRSTLRLNLGRVSVSTGRFADSDRYESVRGRDFIIRDTDDTLIPLQRSTASSGSGAQGRAGGVQATPGGRLGGGGRE